MASKIDKSMKLYILLLVFLVCLYINYRVTVPAYEGFDTVGSVMNILGGLFIIAVVISFISVIALTSIKKTNIPNISKEA